MIIELTCKHIFSYFQLEDPHLSIEGFLHGTTHESVTNFDLMGFFPRFVYLLATKTYE